ncbi:unnamed protein product [Caenorhabditis auriculariae]|uniref:Pepsin inhibitor-3-like repeated domain-containing protein n=1 Tax=Caenorhabditis auriculariae TaxID=2777116 RepID=A0A8S1HSJ6_9PELO|nr:unnamed protein product [Caenorhabditis auriculariae]
MVEINLERTACKPKRKEVENGAWGHKEEAADCVVARLNRGIIPLVRHVSSTHESALRFTPLLRTKIVLFLRVLFWASKAALMAGRILRIGVISVLLSTAAAFSKDVQPGYGYVGPACAVVDGTLFLHGVGTRSLDDYELELFRVYQQDLSAFKESVFARVLHESPLCSKNKKLARKVSDVDIADPVQTSVVGSHRQAGVEERQRGHAEPATHQLRSLRPRGGVVEGIDFPDAPLVPSFCGGHDDSVEVVLSSCIVRNNHVYVGDRLIRSLTNQEKQRVETVKSRKAVVDRRMRRVKRDPEVATGPGTTPQFDFSALLQRLLNVNSTVSSRFLPVVSKSPLFAMDGPWQNLLGLGEGKTGELIRGVREHCRRTNAFGRRSFESRFRISCRFHNPRQAKCSHFDDSDYDYDDDDDDSHDSKDHLLHKAYIAHQDNSKSEAHFIETHLHDSLADFWDRKSGQRAPTTTLEYTSFSLDAFAANHDSGHILFWHDHCQETRFQSDSETVVDPLIISLISRALASNQVLSNLDLPSRPATASIPFHGFVPTAATSSPLHLRFVAPAPGPPSGASTLQAVPGPSHNNVFLPHLSFTSFAKGDQRLAPPSSLASTILPDDICRVHLAIPFF